MDKAEIRKYALSRRAALSDAERARGKILLTERILGHQWFVLSDTLLGFASYGSEIDTGELLSEALRLGKKVYLPRVTGRRDEEGLQRGRKPPLCPPNEEGLQRGRKPPLCPLMDFLRIHSPVELTEGFHGIPEPPRDAEVYEYLPENAERTLMLMPGVAFDAAKNRIGYGAGFYDRYLADKPGLQLRSIAVGFQCQMVEEIPCGAHDIRPCLVLCV